MGNAGYRFLLCIFDLFLTTIVFINYLIWSGAYADIATGTGGDLSNTYFGFQSLFLMVSSYDQVVNKFPLFSFQNFSLYLEGFTRYCLGGIPKFIKSLVQLSEDGFQFYDIVQGFTYFLTAFLLLYISPFIAIGYLLLIIACILYYAYCIIAVLMLAFAGTFNMPFDTPLPSVPEPLNNLRITVPLLI